MLIEYSFDAVLIGMVALFIIVILVMVYRGQKRNPDRSAGEYYADLRRKYDAEQAAKAGIVIENKSKFEPIVILKHFGPNNPDDPKTVPEV